MSDHDEHPPHLEPEEGPDPTLEDPAMRSLAGGPMAPLQESHPRGLWVLFITEMWERFSYYGMRAILVLYLIASTAEVLGDGEANTNPGFGWAEEDAYTLYAVYTFMVYLGALFGGKLADRLLGTHRSMLVGGWIIAAGHITLACTEFFDISLGTVVTRQNSPGAVATFLLGLALIIIGTGFFKPCVSVMVGQLYGENDPRRDSGFTIFYMGINLGAFFSPFVAGTLGEKFGWHWGFGSAAVGMIAGLLFYQAIRPSYLTGIGDPPAERPPGSGMNLLLTALLIGMPLVPLVLYMSGWVAPIADLWALMTDTPLKLAIVWIVVASLLIAVIIAFLFQQNPHERAPLGVIFILAFFGNIFFWTAFEQAGSSLNVFAAQSTDRTLGGIIGADGLAATWHRALQVVSVLVVVLFFGWLWGHLKRRQLLSPLLLFVNLILLAGLLTLIGLTDRTLWGALDESGFPATWYQSINPLCILLFAPVFAWLWLWLDRRKLNPNTPLKFSLGLWLLGLAFVAMYFGAQQAEGGLAGPQWLLLTYIVVTWGELCLSPVGLSMVTRLSPARLQSFMMGVWFFTFALSNLCAGLVARFSRKFIPDAETGQAQLDFMGIDGLPGFFLMLVVVPIAMGVLIAILAPILKRMMHGIR